MDKLLMSKKKLSNGQWEYRGFIIKKKDSLWVIKLTQDNKIDPVLIDGILKEEYKSAKEAALVIDDKIGEPTELEKLKALNEKKIASKKVIMDEYGSIQKKGFGKFNLNIEDAKKIAYFIRNDKEWDLGVPEKRFENGKTKFELTWFKESKVVDNLIVEYRERYGDKYDIEYSVSKGETKIEVSIKI